MKYFNSEKITFKSGAQREFLWYDPERVVQGKKMKDHLRFAASYWHTFVAEGADMFGTGVLGKTFGGTSPEDIYRRKAEAAAEFTDLLGIEYYCFHDRDIAPEGKSLSETNRNLDELSDYLGDIMAKGGKKLLWGTANLFNNPRYMHGAGTAPSADVFAFAAAQVKKAIEITVKLGGSGYVFWGGREGYETLLNTDMALEQENMARLLTMAVEYGRRIGFKGDFYIEPKPKEPTKHQYDFDAATVIGFLRKYDLLNDFKLNIEANHATLAGHTFQHELATARINGVFGSIDANQGDMLLGWDTDEFPFDVYDATLCMLEVLKAGGFTNGGLNFDAKIRRGSCSLEDMLDGYILGMDTFAHGLLAADAIIRGGELDDFVKSRYDSWNTGIGSRIRSGEAVIEELSDYALSRGDVLSSVRSARQEYLENVVNKKIYECK
ncbi:MAG: xylose isomerase [Clostridia bacterium]|nr:xylose isomerase [Clostridia bacterium]